LKEVVSVMKEEFCVSSDAETRICFTARPVLGLSPDTQLRPVTMSNEDKSLEQEGILNGGYCFYIIVKKEDGTWPKNVVSYKAWENHEYSSPERFENFSGEIMKLQNEATSKKRKLEMLNQELKTLNENNKKGMERLREQESESNEIKKLQESLSERRIIIEKDIQGVQTANKFLGYRIQYKERKRQELIEELRPLEKDLDEYAKTSKKILEKVEPESRRKEAGLIEFMTKCIKEKEETLRCPVCLETAKAPIFMCQQMHLICSSCRRRLSVCPECRQRYIGHQRHRYAERDAEELIKLRDELSKAQK